MDAAQVNTFDVETVPLPVVTLNEETRTKMLKFPKPKGCQTRKGTMSTCMAQMLLLDLQRLKLELESEADCCTHAHEHCVVLLETPWKENEHIKKGNHGGSQHAVHSMPHSKNKCAEEGLNSARYSLQATKLKDTNHQEEETEIADQFHIEKGSEAIMNERKGN